MLGMVDIGSLVVVQDKQKFRDSLRSFHNKWTMATVTGTVTGTVTAMGMATATSTATVMATGAAYSPTVMEKEIKKQIKLKYYGHGWKPFDQIVGIVTEITPEEHPDFDVIKIREQTGGVRYCRRFILENA
jgi:urocanate hydratase